MPDTIANPKSAIKKKKQTKKTDRAKRACYHCRKAKSSCSNQRPCARCVRLGQADTCIDIPRSDINDEERRLWDLTLQYLTSHKSNDSSTDTETQLKGVIEQFARRVSNFTRKDPSQSPLLLPSSSRSPPGMHMMDLPPPQNVDYIYLKEQNQQLNSEVQKLLQQLELKKDASRTFYNFSVLSTYGDIAYSRWSYPGNYLLDYNKGFLELSGKSPKELSHFSVGQLYHKKHLLQCSALIYLLCHELVTHVETNQEWHVNGKPVHIKSFINVNVCSEKHPHELVLYSKRSSFPFPPETLFTPLDVRLSQKARDEGFDLQQFFNLGKGKLPAPYPDRATNFTQKVALEMTGCSTLEQLVAKGYKEGEGCSDSDSSPSSICSQGNSPSMHHPTTNPIDYSSKPDDFTTPMDSLFPQEPRAALTGSLSFLEEMNGDDNVTDFVNEIADTSTNTSFLDLVSEVPGSPSSWATFPTRI